MTASEYLLLSSVKKFSKRFQTVVEERWKNRIKKNFNVQTSDDIIFLSR